MLLARFWKQPNKRYRNFQIVFSLLTLNFLIPGIGYLLDPASARAGFLLIGRLLGGTDYPLTEESFLWRILAGTNVVCLAFMCALLQANVRRFWAALYPLVFMKGLTAIAFLVTYFVSLRYPMFWAIFLWDGLAVFLFVWFAGRARRSLDAHPDATLVPRLAFASGRTEGPC